jgi:hypothetical protein
VFACLVCVALGLLCFFDGCRAILKANCYHKHGHDAPCSYDGSYDMLVFGAAQLFLSFIPDFHDMAWLSVVAAVMSFSYAFIGLGLGVATTICKPPASSTNQSDLSVV